MFPADVVELGHPLVFSLPDARAGVVQLSIRLTGQRVGRWDVLQKVLRRRAEARRENLVVSNRCSTHGINQLSLVRARANPTPVKSRRAKAGEVSCALVGSGDKCDSSF